LRVALIHDWLTGMRGGERVLEEFCRILPDATVFTLFHATGSVSPTIEAMPIRTSVLNGIPGVCRHYRYLLPLFPWAVSRFDLRGFDLIVSISHAAAKGIRKPAGSVHICYCLTPMRYIWDMKPGYFTYDDPLWIKRTALQALQYPLRAWDRSTARGVDRFIADSRYVQDRIRHNYGRQSTLIYPPVDTEFFSQPETRAAGNYYLIVSALVSYKRVDIAIEAFNRLGYPLIIAGTGPDLARLKARSAENILFTGFISNDRLRELYRSCRGVIVTAREDFGLVALEAQACGCPVVAFGAGGALETVVDGQTGIMYGERTARGLIEGILRLEHTKWDPKAIRRNAERFSSGHFHNSVREFLEKAVPGAVSRSPGKSGPRSAVKTGTKSTHKSVQGFAGMAKRITDILISLSGLLILGIPLLILALVIRHGSSGPGFYRQIRLGLGRSPFQIIKLRTMYNHAEAANRPKWAVDNDPRCTPLGSILRRYGIDELPQLWNVLRGDMSLVGPRPERPEFQSMFEARLPRFERRLEVRGGLTGLAQVRGWRGDTSIDERLNSDLEYIEAWTFWRDLKILARTPLFLLRQNRNPTKTAAPYTQSCLKSDRQNVEV
jgi:lipopolysaccharide/colanic/teichoic acid biosynthesis glycosyltransferase/glycosyltransferase involved in cell wall biosynthesis